MDVLSRCLWLCSLSWSYLFPGQNALLLETSTVAARKRNQIHWEGIRCFPQIRTLMRKKEKREFLSLFLRKSQEEQEQLIPEIISAGFCIYSTMPRDCGRLLCFVCTSVEEGSQEHSSRGWVRLFTVIDDVTPVKYHRNVSRSFWKSI